MIKVNTHEAKSKLSALIAAVEDNDEIVLICRNGRPVAELRGASTTVDPLATHDELQGVVFHTDPAEPLDPDDWPAAVL